MGGGKKRKKIKKDNLVKFMFLYPNCSTVHMYKSNNFIGLREGSTFNSYAFLNFSYILKKKKKNHIYNL